jgi:cytochrome c biogenesis protein CcmG, thiol:disulfide interchange protein DsbE
MCQAFAAMRVPLVLIACCVLAVGCGSSEPTATTVPTPAQARRELAGAPAPLAALHAQAARLLPGGTRAFGERMSELRGHPAVVNVWASWCGPCKREFPVLQRAAVRYGRTIAFLGVDTQDVSDDARDWLDRRWVPYPSYEDEDGKIAHDVGVRVGIPGTVFFDRDGDVAYLHQGEYHDDEDLERDLQRYLGATPS